MILNALDKCRWHAAAPRNCWELNLRTLQRKMKSLGIFAK